MRQEFSAPMSTATRHPATPVKTVKIPTTAPPAPPGTGAPIGIMDSGVGGLSIRAAITRLLPAESICYFADTAHCPYGGREPEEVTGFCDAIARFLITQKRCKLLVLACNTATAMAVETLRKRYSETPFVGMEPAVKPAAGATRTRAVGVLATAGTFHGRHYRETCLRHAQDIRVVSVAGEGLVELVEAGREDTAECEALVRKHIAPMLAAGVDQIVLGCTHYAFLENALRRAAGPGVELVTAAPAVARRVQSLLAHHALLAREATRDDAPRHEYFSTAPAPLALQLRLPHTPITHIRPASPVSTPPCRGD